MIIGIAIDVCEIRRFAEAIERQPRMVQRLFTPTEAERSVSSLAARFAAKEALAKALGAPAGMRWHDAEVQTDDRGRPFFVIIGTVADRARELGVRTVHLSLSHDAGVASAMVVCEG
ncbi:MAG TPA: holo-ACP synthase [Microlunatus sp.]|nr:holo-ACP synthase [Microlunatus sp.]